MKRLIDITKKLTGNKVNLTSFTIITDPKSDNWQLSLNAYTFINGGYYHYKNYDTDLTNLDSTLKYIRKEYNLIKEFYNKTPRKTLFPLVLLYDLIDKLEQAGIDINNPNIYLTFDYDGSLNITWDMIKTLTYNFNNFDNAVNETIDYLKEKLN